MADTPNEIVVTANNVQRVVKHPVPIMLILLVLDHEEYFKQLVGQAFFEWGKEGMTFKPTAIFHRKFRETH